MIKCICCGVKFKEDYENPQNECENCLTQEKYYYDENVQEEVQYLLNPSGTTQAVFYD